MSLNKNNLRETACKTPSSPYRFELANFFKEDFLKEHVVNDFFQNLEESIRANLAHEEVLIALKKMLKTLKDFGVEQENVIKFLKIFERIIPVYAGEMRHSEKNKDTGNLCPGINHPLNLIRLTFLLAERIKTRLVASNKSSSHEI